MEEPDDTIEERAMLGRGQFGEMFFETLRALEEVEGREFGAELKRKLRRLKRCLGVDDQHTFDVGRRLVLVLVVAVEALQQDDRRLEAEHTL